MADARRLDPERKSTFRADLEGLRAVAVVLVLLYHARIPGFTGGYVGVDVFFVLSGFLITGILLRERGTTGRISLPNFYARRARRILPASALVLVVTVVAAALFMPPLTLPDTTKDAAAAALYVSNMRFGLQATDYLGSQMAPSPILHYWSLGVEEQFYVFWPALVLLVCSRGGSVARRIGITAVVVSVLSFALSLWMTNANAPWAFFSLPTRAWELGIGAVLAVSGSWLARVPARPAAALGWMGLAAVALSGVVLGDSTPFPGTAALLPTLGSALVIVAGVRPSRLAPARLLSTAVPRFLGRISYSLYLWHWPLLVIPAAALGAPLRLPERVALAGAAIVLAAASQHWVEEPLRQGRVIGTRPRFNLAMAAALTLAVAATSLGVGVVAALGPSDVSASTLASDEATVNRIIDQAQVAATAGASAAPLPATVDVPVPAALRPSISTARDLLPDPYADGCLVKELAVDSPPCLYGDVGSPHAVVLFGDSHAASWWPALNELAVQRGWQLVTYMKSACSPSDVLQWPADLKRMYTECQAWREHILSRIAALHPDLVVVSGTTSLTLVHQDGTGYSAAQSASVWGAGLAKTLERLAQSTDHVVVLGDTPKSDFDVPVCLSAHRDSILACATPLAHAVSANWQKATADAARSAGATYVDPSIWVCPSAPCPPVVGNFLVYRDNQHLTPPYAEALAGRLASALPGFNQGSAASGVPGPAPSPTPTLQPAVLTDPPATSFGGRRSRTASIRTDGLPV
jgi:peptidoglycan/LPS O-acetylase OafA/YrhL